MVYPPPLNGLRVLEFAGLAPAPFTGMMLADFGASVLRIDRAQAGQAVPPAADLLTRRKASIAVDLKADAGIALVKSLIPSVDIVIDPFRPGVLEKVGLSPALLLRLNPRLIFARLTGFRRDGKHSQMAGHDINYLAVSGVLSMLGRKGGKPYAPGNIIADFAGGGAMCFMGILLALLHREQTGLGQVVESNMVDGTSYLGTFMRLASKTEAWNKEMGNNLLDGGCPYYDVYETSDGGFMSVGALEPQFFRMLLKGLEIDPRSLSGPREDKRTWPHLRELFTKVFRTKTRAEWESIFDGLDACCLPVYSHAELESEGYGQRPPVTLVGSPALALKDPESEERASSEGQGLGVQGEGWTGQPLAPGSGGEEVLGEWMGWVKGRQYREIDGGLVKSNVGNSKL